MSVYQDDIEGFHLGSCFDFVGIMSVNPDCFNSVFRRCAHCTFLVLQHFLGSNISASPPYCRAYASMERCRSSLRGMVAILFSFLKFVLLAIFSFLE